MLEDQFLYIGSNISSTESDFNIHLAKALTTFDRLSIIRKSDTIKRDFFQVVGVSILRYECTTWMLTKRLEKKLDKIYTKTLRAVFNKP